MMAVERTVGKYLNNEGTVRAFFNGTYDEGHAYGLNNSNVFYIADTLYSYGYHFPMAIKLGFYYLVNADSYSSSTGKHQSYVQNMVPSSKKIEIPFSALDEAGVNYHEIHVLDKEESRYVEVMRRVDGKEKMVGTHLMGSTLFRAEVEVPNMVESKYRPELEQYGTKKVSRLLLSGIDETAKDLWNGFFLTEVVGNPTTVEEAYASMKPEEIKIAEENGEKVLRQGEYFFREETNSFYTSLLNIIAKGKSDTHTMLKNQPLSHKTRDANLEGTFRYHDSRHVVTNYIDLDGEIFAKGTCRHKAGEHKMLKLDGWYKVYENIQKKSWTAQGRVD